MRYILTLIVFLGLAFAASAGNWHDCSSLEQSTTLPAHGNSACYDAVTGDLDSVILEVGHCENEDIRFNSDTGGTGTAHTVQIMACVAPVADTDNCTPIRNVTLTGSHPNDVLNGTGERWIYVNGTGDPTTETPRVIVTCNK